MLLQPKSFATVYVKQDNNDFTLVINLYLLIVILFQGTEF